MGCNCKGKSKENGNFVASGSGLPKKDLNFGEKVIVFIAKTIGFIIGGIIISIIVIPFSLYTLFKIIYLDESIDVTNTLISLGKLLRIDKDGDEEEYDEEMLDEDFNPNDYELLDVDEIIENK